MGKIRKLISRKRELEEELKKINEKLDDMGYSWGKFAEEFQSRLGVKPVVSNSSITAKSQRDRVRLMLYLIEHEHTSENAISYEDLVDILDMKNIQTILGMESRPAYSPLHGGLKVKGKDLGKFPHKRFYIEELYIEDIEKAKLYVGLIKKLIELPEKNL